MKTNRITVIFYALAFGIAIGYWAGQENIHASQPPSLKVGK